MKNRETFLIEVSCEFTLFPDFPQVCVLGHYLCSKCGIYEKHAPVL
jgi:hypothetical protein